MKIGSHQVGKRHPTFIIAEIGATHAGDVEQALKLIEVAGTLGVQAVKLQTVDPEYSYRKGTLSHEIFTTLKLPEEGLARMKKAADALGLILFTTPGDFPSLDLAIRLGFELMKISSGLMTNLPLVTAAAKIGKPLIISSGMAYLDEIARSLRVAREAGATELAALHCVSVYPCPDDLVNLRAIAAMETALGVPVGYSDHTFDALACVAAVAAGARILEKHLALSHELAGPEQGTACDPAEFKRMVEQVRRVDAMKGNGIKAPSAQEMNGRILNRRKLMALKPIARGEIIGTDNIGLMRGTIDDIGLEPEFYDRVIGMKAARDILDNEPIRLGMVLEP